MTGWRSRGLGETLRALCRTWGMRYSRTGIVAVLLAAEVFLGGAIIWTLMGGRWAGSLQAAGSLHQVSEQGKTFAPIDAGSIPHVVIDDPDSRVVISSSTDGKVHVTDDTRTVGWVWGTSGPHATLSVAKTADGVSITRGDGQPQVAIIGFDYQHTDVEVPAGAFIDVRRCGGATISGLAGQVRIHSVDGSISGTGLRVTGGQILTDDGRVRLAFDGANLNVHAKTSDGSIHFDGRRVARDDESAGADLQIGTGGGSLLVSSQDGSIHISTNGAL